LVAQLAHCLQDECRFASLLRAALVTETEDDRLDAARDRLRR